MISFPVHSLPRPKVMDAFSTLNGQGVILHRLPPATVLMVSGLTDSWRQRQLSNFDYLMQLNTIAGTREVMGQQ